MSRQEKGFLSENSKKNLEINMKNPLIKRLAEIKNEDEDIRIAIENACIAYILNLIAFIAGFGIFPPLLVTQQVVMLDSNLQL